MVIRKVFILAVCWLTVFTARSNQPTKPIDSWDPNAAAKYLDNRVTWWMNWPGAALDHGTFCVSCHTAVPYALARPILGKLLEEPQPPLEQRQVLENVKKRVRLWSDVAPFYSDKYGGQKAIESRGTEAVLSALILANNDANNGNLTDDTQTAFRNMWALQRTSGDESGSWSWLRFGAEPWEASDSQYYGATLAAIATGIAPENYGAAPEIQNNLKLLKGYLGREYSRQSLINQVMLLWASSKVPGLLKPEQRNSIIKTVLSKQQEDGGWRLPPLAWRWDGWRISSIAKLWLRPDLTSVETRSDGYATGLIAFVLQQLGLPPDEVHLRQALSWLRCNQNRNSGLWLSYSLNRRRAPSTNVGLFMSDAATAYAVLALAEHDRHQFSHNLINHHFHSSDTLILQQRKPAVSY